ncbi:SDR family NAD(P)-dependent oxidoreductase [Pseudomonas fluorescens]|uniref:2,3-dihydroxy-2,3-dihydro-p-cumate dehydrogenase n=1 Tax=Pseudomonas fluorescens TaxID=294 RepID=A0A5E7AKQ2_PSEFL|nr:SDR family NAD(P)-dependent oxidoreductase [Pseudomonas fluorescens]VVN79075.1 putative oxidoreductase [Pseudomonas fluorescens]
MKMNGRVALITGGAGGLGQAIALRMASEGACVVICDINEEALEATRAMIEDLGAQCLALRCDVSSSTEVNAMFDQIDARFGTLHILVNNAALVPDKPHDDERRKRHYALVTQPLPRQSLEITRNMDDAEWKRFWAVNVDGVFYCTRAALQRMEPQGYGKVINIASIAGISAMGAHSPHYSAAKGAVVAFTRAVAYEVAGANVQVNAICPGGVQTPAFERYLDQQSPEQLSVFKQVMPLGRLGKAEEYAALVSHLASDECYLVGSIINAGGGTYI